MLEQLKTDICIIGAGSGGLSLAVGAANMGARVILIEKGKMGGDCLNYGCVPSKALLAAGHLAHSMQNAQKFGIESVTPNISYARVHDHIQTVIQAIEPNDSVERMESFGIKVISETARFIGFRQVQAGNYLIDAKKIVIATGSHPVVPQIPGLDSVNYFTNETIFNNIESIDHLMIIGGGPIGAEMAQAHRHLGSSVTVIQYNALLPRDDQEAVEVLRQQFRQDGITLYEQSKAVNIVRQEDDIILELEKEGEKLSVKGSHLLIAVGRIPCIKKLDLDVAGIDYTPKGITVNNKLQTSNKHVYAIGDVNGTFLFTHMASYQASIVLRQLLFKLPASVKSNAVPWVTYTDPELAQVGLTQVEADRQNLAYKVTTWPFSENDRAQSEHQTEGFIKVITDKRARILGVTIVGPRAGELLLPWILAINNKLKMRDIAGIIAPYPTLSELSKRVAGQYYTPYLFSERTKKLVRFLMRLTR